MVSKGECEGILLIALFLAWSLAPVIFTFTNNGSGLVLSSTKYNAGTIQDNETYNVIGYNITFTYRGTTAHTQVLCPLYPVGSRISVNYVDWFWVYPVLKVSGLPQGCQMGTSNLN
jgi:hypothetical protein